MDKEIQIKKVNVDWLNIIKLALNKQDWGKTYVLYNYGDVVVSTEITSFNFLTNKATFLIKCEYPELNNYSWKYETSIEYFLKNFTVEDFKGVLQSKVKGLLIGLLLDDAEKKAGREFSEDYYITSDIDEDVIEQHGFLDDYEKSQELSDDMGELIKDNINEQILIKLNEEYNDKVFNYKQEVLKTGENVNSMNLYKLYKSMVGAENEINTRTNR